MDLELPKDRQQNGYLGLIADEVAQIKEIILSRMSQMELLIQEAKVFAVTEARQVEELKESFEAKAAGLEARLQEKEEILHKENSALEELEKNLAGKILDLENRVREKEQLVAIRDAVLKDLKSRIDALNVSPQGLITLREEDAIALKEPEDEEGKVARRSEVQEEESQGLEEHLAVEVQRLRAEIKEKDMLLAAREMEVKMIKRSMEERVQELEGIVKRQTGEEQKKSRLVSFVGTLDRKN